MNQTFTQTITVENRYPDDYTIPKGYRAVAFRLQRPGEYWLKPIEVIGEDNTVSTIEPYEPLLPVIILEKIHRPKWEMKVIEDEPRRLRTGEYGITSPRMKNPFIVNGPSTGLYVPVSFTLIKE